MNSKHALSAAAAIVAGITIVAGAVSPAIAASDPPNPPKKQEVTQAAPSIKDDKRKFCIASELTGSRIAKQECRTRAEWASEGVDPLELMKNSR